MKLIKVDKDRFWFHIPEREKQLLTVVLAAYPLVPEAHQKLSRTVNNLEAEKMLEEATAAQRRENKERIGMFLTANLQPQDGGFRLVLQPSQMEWLLQVLNDVRVGSWLLLGSPNGQVEAVKKLNESTAKHFWTMEIAGEFEQRLLQVLDGRIKPQEPEPPAAI